jgi:hypothetical protein
VVIFKLHSLLVLIRLKYAGKVVPLKDNSR